MGGVFQSDRVLRVCVLWRGITQRPQLWHPFAAQTTASGPFCDRSASELQEMTQFGPNGHKTDMLRSSEAQSDAGIGLFGRFHA